VVFTSLKGQQPENFGRFFCIKLILWVPLDTVRNYFDTNVIFVELLIFGDFLALSTTLLRKVSEISNVITLIWAAIYIDVGMWIEVIYDLPGDQWERGRLYVMPGL
jgi:hypothetical protein